VTSGTWILVVAHGAARHLEAREILRWWSWEPAVVALLSVTAIVYLGGLVRLWRSAGRDHGTRWWEVGAFAAGWLALVAALLSPLDALGAILFSAHMAQHEVLMLVAAPLMVLGRPLVPFLWALPRRAREQAGGWTRRSAVRGTWRRLTGPLAVFGIHGAALWVWHLPSLYQATLRSEGVHALQHLSFFGSAALFWWALLHGRYGRSGYGLAVLYVFATGVHSGALGALLTFAPRVWYPIYDTTARQWGLSAIEDQQLAGLIMWVPAGLVFLVIGLALVGAWLREAARRVAHTESEALLQPEGHHPR
jgi:cytochrome c oxidase assembly factor CtaG